MLNVSEIGFAYRNRTVLERIGFDLEPGRILVILGPNGVGKTTLIRCLNAIHKPSKGSVLLEDEDLLRLSPPRMAMRVGYVSQRTETARLTVYDAVLMGRKPHMGLRVALDDRDKTEAAIARLGLEPLALRHIDELSGGELQKVAIARALVQEPRLLLLDEPTSALDLRNQFEILTLLREAVRERGMATVMTMHDLNTALRFADEVLLLKGGSILAHVPTDGVTPDLIEATYGLPVAIHHLDGVPVVVPQFGKVASHATA
jgi:iron complex transport system ATP-binding protein